MAKLKKLNIEKVLKLVEIGRTKIATNLCRLSGVTLEDTLADVARKTEVKVVVQLEPVVEPVTEVSKATRRNKKKDTLKD